MAGIIVESGGIRVHIEIVDTPAWERVSEASETHVIERIYQAAKEAFLETYGKKVAPAS